MKEIAFSEVANGQKFMIGKSTLLKGNLGQSVGGWYGKGFSSWKFVANCKIVKVEDADTIL